MKFVVRRGDVLVSHDGDAVFVVTDVRPDFTDHYLTQIDATCLCINGGWIEAGWRPGETIDWCAEDLLNEGWEVVA